MNKYAIEIVNPVGALIADLTGRAAARRITLSRNEAEDIQFVIDINEFERYCRLLSVTPQAVLAVYQNEVRVKRGENYICAGQIGPISTHVDVTRQEIQVRATGFLNLFKDRYTATERIFTGTEATEIASTLIEETQALTNGDYGITIGTLEAVGAHDRTYRRTNIKEALQDLTRVQNYPFDFEFTYNKVFNAYQRLGSIRPEIVFEYPNNIIDFTVPNDPTGLANEVTAIGDGISGTAPEETVSDTDSQLDYSLRQKFINVNNVSEADTLTDHATAELEAWKNPSTLPVIRVDGNKAPFIGGYHLGDYVRVKLMGYAMINSIDSLYRIEKIDIQIDDNDNEEISLTLSATGISTNKAEQQLGNRLINEINALKRQLREIK